MNSWRINFLILAIIVLTAVAAGFFVYPGNIGQKYLPWRLGLDLAGGTALIYEVDLANVAQKDHQSIVAGLKEVIERRVNLYGISEPKVTTLKKGDTYQLLVELAGVRNLGEAVKQIGETPQLDFRELKFVDNTATSTVAAIPTNLTGRNVISATWIYDQAGINPVVSFELDQEGAKLFEEITGRNIGKQLCIFVDNTPQGGCPTVQEKIEGGRAQITGLALDEAKMLVARFKAGALGAPIKLVNQRTVSPSAATDALNKMIMAGSLGLALVALFMIIYYRTLGIFAVLALLIYTTLTLAAFKVTSITMTLSGIAGFILSIGMAVDANILIFARIREELKKGLSRASAIEEGFKRAWSPIRDSNTSTILTAIILYYFTSSFVRGFALTLFVGVILSMFSAVFVTRNMLKVIFKR